MTQYKQCTACAKEGVGPKPVTEFGPAKAYKDGLRSWCKQHSNAYVSQWRKQFPVKNRIAYLRAGFEKRYGLTFEKYQDIYASQRGACAICGVALKSQVEVAQRCGGDIDKNNTAHVDHCHTTGVVRGLLCSCCNTGIGQLKESPMILASAINYLTVQKVKAPEAPGSHP